MTEKDARSASPASTHPIFTPAYAAAAGPGDFPWTWDQFQRYSVLAAFIGHFYSGGSPLLLDVGGLSPLRTGAGAWLPAKRIYAGNTLVLDTTFHQEPGFIQGDGGRLPFKSASFDIVSALDVIEHLPAGRREIFISEICRVSRGAVVMSAPFQDPYIEEAERLLFDEIVSLYGIEHRQLLEHREYGLPEPGAVSAWLSSALPGASAAEFSYGSLLNWIYHQSIKNVFMFRKEAEAIHELMDRWLASRHDYWDFEPPFSRRFWISSRAAGRRKLNRGIAKMMSRLGERRPSPPPFGDLLRLSGSLAGFVAMERVLAVVVTEGEGAHLEECLAHLFTQEVDFDLEILVWELAGGGDAGPRAEGLRNRFPGLRYFSPRDGKNLQAALLELGFRSTGRFMLLLADDILLPQSSVADFRNALSSCSEYDLLSPEILFQEKAGQPAVGTAGFGKEGDMQKFAGITSARQAVKPDASEADWLRSECQFFRREALAGRRLKKDVPSKKEIFLWEKEGRDRKILFAPEFIVHKCPTT